MTNGTANNGERRTVNQRRHFPMLVAEIGSTTTLISAIGGLHGDCPQLVGQGLHSTTVAEGDVLVGVDGALQNLADRLGATELTWDDMLASSSAAGGLQMTVHGLVYDMTAKAANEAALGAGAVVRMVTAGELSATDVHRIGTIAPNIILLAGGVDHGERATVLHNARRLTELELACPVIYAGNTACREEVKELLGERVRVVPNVYPRIDELNIKPTREAIQEVFEEHIVAAPGMRSMRRRVSGDVMPTPGAVMKAAELLQPAVGNVMVLDVGGATTDVHSVTKDSAEVARMLIAPEPVAKRTVEGDLGVFKNAANLVERIGKERLADDLGFEPNAVLEGLQPLPADQDEQRLVVRLAEEAVRVAVERHAGHTRHLYGPAGRSTIAEGKDLTLVRWIIGTGGPLTALPEGSAILEELTKTPPPMALYPREAEVRVDADYVMAVCGVLAGRYPEAALTLLLQSLGIEPKVEP